jgi:hypothetical protein
VDASLRLHNRASSFYEVEETIISDRKYMKKIPLLAVAGVAEIILKNRLFDSPMRSLCGRGTYRYRHAVDRKINSRHQVHWFYERWYHFTKTSDGIDLSSVPKMLKLVYL